MISLLKIQHNFFMQFVALLIFIFLLPVGICSQPREIIFDGTGSLTRDIVKAKLAAENLQLNEEWSATIRGYTEIGVSTFRPQGWADAANLIVDTNRLMFNLISVTIENGCETIGSEAFMELPALTTVSIKSNLKAIKEDAFAYDSALVNITLPETVNTIDHYAFVSCVNLNLSKLPDNLTTLGGRAFAACEKITISEIPKGINTINSTCFRDCKSITQITLHENIKNIEHEAFLRCINLKKITCLADIVPTIKNAAFVSQHPDKKLYVKKGMRAAFLRPAGECAIIGLSCWIYQDYGAFVANNILELPDRIEVIISANDENLGNIEIETSADMDNLQVDDILELTAIPNGAGCHRFICWKNETTGEIISKYKAITYVVNTATELVAVFE